MKYSAVARTPACPPKMCANHPLCELLRGGGYPGVLNFPALPVSTAICPRSAKGMGLQGTISYFRPGCRKTPSVIFLHSPFYVCVTRIKKTSQGDGFGLNCTPPTPQMYVEALTLSTSVFGERPLKR